MEFKIIDMDNWSRKETFDHFSTVAKSTYSLTVKVDVTSLVEKIKKDNLRFYPIFTWIITKALNQFEQFKMGYDAEGRLGYYSYINPMYSVMDKDKNVVSLCTEFEEKVSAFYKKMTDDLENFEKDGKETAFYPNFYIVSTLPWLHYESFTVLNESEQHFLFPMVTWGKYVQENGKYMIPLALQVSHAVADGYHCAQFYEAVEQLIKEFDEIDKKTLFHI